MAQSISRLSSSSKKKSPRTKTGWGTYERIGVAMLGLMLVAASLLKLLSFLGDAPGATSASLISVAFAETELIVGFWYLIDSRNMVTLPWALATSAGLVIASFYQILAGFCICNRFGDRDMNPWLALTIDLAVLATLKGGRIPFVIYDVSQIRLAPAIVVLAVGILSARDAGLVTISGTASLDGRPLDDTSLTVVGNLGPITIHTDHNGHFRLPGVRPGMYLVSTSANSSKLSLAPLKSGVSKRKMEPIPDGWQKTKSSSIGNSVDPWASLNISGCGARNVDIILESR